MRKELKEQVIASISAQLQETPDFYVTDISGLNAEQTSKLRRECFENGITLTVVKNTLFNHVIKDTDNEELKQICSVLEGNSAIMYTTSPAAPAKVIKKLQKAGFEKPVVKGAYVQECAFIGTDKLEVLAGLKSKNELVGDIIALLQSPIRRVVAALENASENKEGAEEQAPAETNE